MAYEMLSSLDVEPQFPVVQQDKMCCIFSENEIRFIKQIGGGGMSEIALYYLRKDGFPCEAAVKTLCPKYATNNRDLFYLQREADILTEVKHENIIQTFGLAELESTYGLVLEYMPNGSYIDFFDRVKSHEDIEDKITKEDIAVLKVRILNEVISAMKYLHCPRELPRCKERKSILHLDLKGNNVLLDGGLHAKLCDFGLSMLATLTKLRTSATMHGSLVINDYGLLEYHVATKNLRPDITNIPSIYPTKLVAIMERCWDALPDKRPSFEELEHQMRMVTDKFVDFDKRAYETAKKLIEILDEISSRQYTPSTSSDRGTTTGTRTPTTESSSTDGHSTSRHSATTAAKELRNDHSSPGAVVPGTAGQTALDEVGGFPGDSNHDDPDASFLARLVSSPENSNGLPGTFHVRGPFCSLTKILLGVSVAVIVAAAITIGIVIPIIHKASQKKPNDGEISCETGSQHTSEKCRFNCNQGYAMVGSDTTTCVGGKWSNKVPSCAIACRKIPTVPYEVSKCSNQSFANSTCSFSCTSHRVIKGKANITCLKSGNWSDPFPSCICPTCSTGSECQHSISWQEVSNVLDAMEPYGVITVEYGEETFICRTKVHSVLKLDFTGICIDKNTGTKAGCSDDHTSPSGSAEAAAAVLIRDLAGKNIYPHPCDPENMPTDC